MEKKAEVGEKFERLVGIIAALRGEGGCPWDRKQDERSISNYFLEEVYEVVEAVVQRNIPAVSEELGDCLMEIVFLARIYEEKGVFSVEEALDRINEKMVRRHPHVFQGKKAATTDEVVDEWQRLKGLEKKPQSVLDGLPKSLPALLAAFQIGQRVSAYGFDWRAPREAMEKVKEELAELEKALASGEDGEREQELGDLFFSLANVSRLLGINPEMALRRANEKFRRRFEAVEEELKKQGKALGQATLEEMDEIWDEIKIKM